jgi:hypothetical protein
MSRDEFSEHYFNTGCFALSLSFLAWFYFDTRIRAVTNKIIIKVGGGGEQQRYVVSGYA